MKYLNYLVRGRDRSPASDSPIAFIDSDANLLRLEVLQLQPNTEIVIIDPERDGIEQITEVLATKRNVPRLQIIGSDNDNEASLQLGLAQLNIYTLEVYLEDLLQWREALSANSDIIISGLQVTIESLIRNFTQRLANITDADVAVFSSCFDNTVTRENSDNLECDSLIARHAPSQGACVIAMLTFAWRSLP